MTDLTVEIYTLSDEFVTDTQTNEDGNFLIQGLESGSYILKIEQEGYLAYTSESINVTVGLIESAGIIELQTIE